MKTQIFVDNLKFQHSADLVIKGLMAIPEVSTVAVYPEKGLVRVEYCDPVISKIKEKLSWLGYPEKDGLQDEEPADPLDQQPLTDKEFAFDVEQIVRSWRPEALTF